MPSVALARTREALHNGDKTVPKDAQVILHMLKIGATQTYAILFARALTISRSACHHQSRFRLSVLLRRTDAKRENLSQQVP